MRWEVDWEHGGGMTSLLGALSPAFSAWGAQERYLTPTWFGIRGYAPVPMGSCP